MRLDPEIDLRDLKLPDQTKAEAVTSAQVLSKQAKEQTGSQTNSVILWETEKERAFLKTIRPRGKRKDSTKKILGLNLTGEVEHVLLEKKEEEHLKAVIVDALVQANKKHPINTLTAEQQREFLQGVLEINRDFQRHLIGQIEEVINRTSSRPNSLAWLHELISLLSKSISILLEHQHDIGSLSREQKNRVYTLLSTLTAYSNMFK